MNNLFIKKFNQIRGERGFVTLISVLVVGAVGTAITVSLILLGLASSRTSFALEQSNQAKGLANACTEEALERIRELTAFVGSGNLSFGQGTCTYNVVNTGGSNRTATATGSVGTTIRNTSVLVNVINPRIILTSWQEVSS